MVLKGTKRSLRTGNTLRATGNRHRSSNGIVRHVTNPKGGKETPEADDSHITADEVVFSLNKKGRWNLPQVIEENIEHCDTGGAAVALLHRHRLNRKNDCLSVVASATFAADHTATDMVLQRKKARRKMYCNGLNVLHNGRGKSKTETRKKKVVSTKKDLAQQKQGQTLETVPENTEVPTMPKVRYDVFHPVPATSSLRFHSKFAASGASYSDQALIVTSNAKPRGSYQRCKHVDYDDLYGEDDYYDDWIYDEEDCFENGSLVHAEYTENGCHGDEAQAMAPNEQVFLYSDFIEQAFETITSRPMSTAETASVKKKRRRTRKKRGGRFFYAPHTENESDSCLEDSESETSVDLDSSFSKSPQPTVMKFPEMPSATVKLSGKATCPQRLAEQYGHKYSEAACCPRKIVIEISDRVQTAMTNLSAFYDVFVPSLDLTTYVILTYISAFAEEHELQNSCSSSKEKDKSCSVSGLSQCPANTSQYDMYRVQLNMNSTAQGRTFSLKGRREFDDVEDVLEQVFHFMITLTPENIARHPCQASASALKSRFTPDFSTVAAANSWNASCVSLLDEKVIDRRPLSFAHKSLQSRHAIDQEEGSHCSNSDDACSPEMQFSDVSRHQMVQMEASNAMYCGICFSEIFPGSLSGPQATALTECQHWFCDTCWQCHLSVAMQENRSKTLQCPEFQCKVEVDLGTLLSLQSTRDVLLQQRRLVEVKVTRMSLCKWCPNPHCGRVVKLAASPSTVPAEPTSMACPCGQQFCFRCHGEPHWPLGCEHLADYHAFLHKNRHFMGIETKAKVVVRGKACPSCHIFIEKCGGCPAVYCVCGFEFWWCCRKPTSHRHSCSNNFVITDTFNTTKKVLRASKTDVPCIHESKWSEMALLHRSLQLRKHVRREHKRAEQLCRRLLMLYAKGVDLGVLLELPESRSAGQKENRRSRQSGEVKTRGSGQLYSKRDDDDDEEEEAASRDPTLLQTVGVPRPAAGECGRQCIKQTTHAIIRLKVELHNVLEHTAALLHLRQSAQGSDRQGPATLNKVEDAVGALQLILTYLDGLLEASSRRELTQVLLWFRRLQRQARDALTTLAHVVHC